MNDYFGHPSSSSDKDKVISDALAAENINDRAQNIFRRIVDQYLETGSPVGSKSIAAGLGGALSSASIRSIMADLEKAGLLFQPHTSSGRLPTEIGLRLFVNGLMEMGVICRKTPAAALMQNALLMASVSTTLWNRPVLPFLDYRNVRPWSYHRKVTP